jgi:hypothetical protein
MSENKYLSDIFKDDPIVDGDISQSLMYKFIKAYPSVNSTNGGQIHSEENVRWLTRQFTKKPFIIPYTDNETFDEFWYEGAVLNAGRCNGGMVNIDGYIINAVDATNKTSFDNEEDTSLSTGDSSGYILHQRLQRAISELLSQFNSSIYTYTDKFVHTWAQQGKLTENCTKLDAIFSYNYKLLKREDVSDIDPATIAEYKADVHSVYPDIKDDIHVQTSTYDITYSDVIGEYVYENFPNILNLQNDDNYKDYVVAVVDESTSETINGVIVVHHAYKVTYNVFYGIIPDILLPHKDNTNTYESTLSIKDILGFYYVWSAKDTNITTNTYPGTVDTNINFLNNDNNIIPHANDNQSVANGVVLGQTKLYDTSALYSAINAADSHYADFVNIVTQLHDGSTIYNNLDLTKIVERNNALSANSVSLSDLFNSDVFDRVEARDVISRFKAYNDNNLSESDFTQDRWRTGGLATLCDYYFCLPINNIHASCKTFLCKQDASGNPIDIGFMTSAGVLMARNYQFTKVVSGVVTDYVLIESYVSFFRRLVAKVCGLDLSTLPDPDDYNNNRWNNILKDFQMGKLSVNLSGVETDEYNMFIAIFGNIANITFENLYNTFIAPYINLHMQVAWSSLYDLDVDYTWVPETVINQVVYPAHFDRNPKYKAHWAYNIIAPALTSEDHTVNDRTALIGEHWQQYPHVNVERIHTYKDVDDHEWNITKYIPFFYNQYTDNGRLDATLRKNDYHKWASGLGYYAELENNSTLDELTDKYTFCEDYISYIKNCSCRGWDDTYVNVANNSNALNLLNIKYRITGLNHPSQSYGFTTLDNIIIDRVAKFVNFDTSTPTGGTRYAEITTATAQHGELLPITPGYINNVAIRLDTLVPYRRDMPNAYFWYPEANSQPSTLNMQENPTNPDNFDLWMIQYATREVDGVQTYGLSGYSFRGRTNTMTTFVPMMFRLFKDSQNYLNGIKNDGSSVHAGIYIDYKFPRDVETTDFWFANTWLSNITSVATWEIESRSCSAPSTTDAMQEYLNIRNKTILSIDQIYDVDDKGEYTSLTNVINNYFYEDNKQTQADIQNVENELIEKVDNSTEQFIKATPTPRNNISDEVDLIYDYSVVTGLWNMIHELREEVEQIRNIYSKYPLTGDTIILCNNQCQDIRGDEKSELTLQFEHDYSSELDYYNSGIDTVRQKTFNSTIRLTIGKSCKINLSNSIYKQFLNLDTINNHIPVSWSSNYSIVNCQYRTSPTERVDDETYCTLDDYIMINNTSTKPTLEILIDVTVDCNSVGNQAYGYCKISTINDSYQLTMEDMNKLICDNYALNVLTWEQVSRLTKLGMAKKLWKLGDIKTFNMYYTDTSTQERVPVEVPAMIIGFDQDGENTITWMTMTDSAGAFGPVLSQKFYTDLGTNANDGYIPAANTLIDNYNGAPIWHWLNDYNEDSICTGVVDEDMHKIILPVRKSSRMLYLVNDNGTYHKYGYDNTSHTSCGYYRKYPLGFSSPGLSVYYPGGYIIPSNFADRYGIYYNTESSGAGGDPFWLPTLYELGLSPIDDTCPEKNAYNNATLNTSNYYDEDVVKFSSLRIIEKANTPESDWDKCDKYDAPIFTYDYFKLPREQQNVTGYIQTRNYYAVTNDDITGVDFSDEPYNELYNKYATANRSAYLIQAQPTTGTDNKHFEVVERDTASAAYVLSNFCFVTY